MYELKKKIWKVFTSKFVGTGPSSYEKGIYLATISQRLRNTNLDITRLTLSDPVFVLEIKLAVVPWSTQYLSSDWLDQNWSATSTNL